MDPLVAQRAIAPALKLEATRWARREEVLPGVAELTDDGLFSATDFLLEWSERVQEAVFFSIANLLNSGQTRMLGDRRPGEQAEDASAHPTES